MNQFPCLIRSSTLGGEPRFALGDPLVDSYLAFVTGRSRPNTLRAVAHDLKTFFSVIDKDPVDVVAAASSTSSLIMDLRTLLATTSHDVVLELTEHDAVDDYEPLQRALLALGHQVAIDDTGAGFACLRHALMLAPDFLKLDRAWIAGIDRDPGRQALVEAIAHLAAAIDAWLVAGRHRDEAGAGGRTGFRSHLRPRLPARSARCCLGGRRRFVRAAPLSRRYMNPTAARHH